MSSLANVNQRDSDGSGRTALHHAAGADDYVKVIALLNSDASTTLMDAHNRTPILYAAERASWRAVHVLLDASPCDTIDPTGRSVLHWACSRRQSAVVLHLLHVAVNIDPSGALLQSILSQATIARLESPLHWLAEATATGVGDSASAVAAPDSVLHLTTVDSFCLMVTLHKFGGSLHVQNAALESPIDILRRHAPSTLSDTELATASSIQTLFTDWCTGETPPQVLAAMLYDVSDGHSAEPCRAYGAFVSQVATAVAVLPDAGSRIKVLLAATIQFSETVVESVDAGGAAVSSAAVRQGPSDDQVERGDGSESGSGGIVTATVVQARTTGRGLGRGRKKQKKTLKISLAK